MRYLPLILKNCWRNRRRTVLTIASIGVSMCLLGVVVSMYHAFYMGGPAPDEAVRLVVRNRISIAVSIPLSYRDRIQHIPGVREVMYANYFQGVYKDARNPKNMFARFAVDPEKLFKVFGEFRISEDQKRAFLRERAACVIGRDVADNLHLKLGDRIPIKGDIFPGDFEFTVRGIFDSPRNSEVMWACTMSASTIRITPPASPKPSTTNSATPPPRPKPKASRLSRWAFSPCWATSRCF
jgi:putative ABC transport system permease protein